MTWKGPLVSDYLKEDRIGIESTVWSPCGTEGLLNIKSSIGLLQGTSKAAQMTVSFFFPPPFDCERAWG